STLKTATGWRCPLRDRIQRRPAMMRSGRTAKRDKRSDADYQRAVGEFVHREVIYCVSNLVYEIGRKNIDDWHHLFVQEDWQTPALKRSGRCPTPSSRS